jgi:glucose-6-phosphate 1-dehydrogenase
MADAQVQKILKQLKNHERRISELEHSAIVNNSALNKNLPEIKMVASEKINFDMSERAFIRKYRKEMSGPKKFVLLLSYLVKGEVGKEISVDEVERHWNKLKSVLKAKKKEKMEFNSYYANEAKNNNWVDSKKFGFYFLTREWINIFAKKKK